MKNYGIREGYIHRETVLHWDDAGYTDEWQREVYLCARAIMDANKLTSVLDVGCGSGWKLEHYFKGKIRAGVEVEPTLSVLRETVGRWYAPDEIPPEKFDLVICADVIEHVPDPDELCRLIRRHANRTVLISTPDRDLYPDQQWQQCHDGPPFNECHAREWNFLELDAYMRTQFHVLGHFVTNRVQTTQLVVAEV